MGDAFIIQLGRALQILLNLATFVLLARGLGPQGFGVFSTIVAVLATAFAISDLGLGQLTVRAVAQSRLDEMVAVRQATTALYITATLILVVCCVISSLVAGIGPRAGVICALLGFSYLHVQARVGIEKAFWLGALRVLRVTAIEVMIALLRLVGVLGAWIAGARTVLPYAWAIAASGALALIATHWWLRYPTAATVSDSSFGVWPVIREALPFAAASLTWNAFGELPKVLLAPIAGTLAVGFYAAGARILNVAFLPLQSVLHVIAPRLFASTRGAAPRTMRERTLLRWAGAVTGLAALVAALVSFAAPLVPLVLGSQYADAIPVLRALTVSLPFQALAFTTGDWLAGVGRQRLRLVLTLATLGIGSPFIAIAAHQGGALGAAWAFSAATAVLALATSVSCWNLIRQA